MLISTSGKFGFVGMNDRALSQELITLRKFLDLFMWSTLISSEEIRNYGDN